MSNRSQQSAATSCQVIQEVIPNNSPKGASHRDRRMNVIPDPRETGSKFPAGSCFFRVEREESPYKVETQKKGEGRRWTNGWACGRTNEGSSKSYNEGRKEGKKGTRQSAAFVRFSALVLFVVVGSAGVLVPSNHWLVPKWMNKREIELPLFLFLSLLQRWSITRWPRKNIEGETEKHSTRDAARNGKEEKHRKERKERVGKIGDETNRERRKRDGS